MLISAAHLRPRLPEPDPLDGPAPLPPAPPLPPPGRDVGAPPAPLPLPTPGPFLAPDPAALPLPPVAPAPPRLGPALAPDLGPDLAPDLAPDLEPDDEEPISNRAAPRLPLLDGPLRSLAVPGLGRCSHGKGERRSQADAGMRRPAVKRQTETLVLAVEEQQVLGFTVVHRI